MQRAVVYTARGDEILLLHRAEGLLRNVRTDPDHDLARVTSPA